MDESPRSLTHPSLSLRQALHNATKADSVLLGTVLDLHSVNVARVIAGTNCDWVAIDADSDCDPHSTNLLSEMIQAVRTHSQGRIIPIVRVPSHTAECISWAIKAGAGGIIMPHAKSVEQVLGVVNASKLPLSPHRLSRPFLVHSGSQEGEEIRSAEHVGIIPQIESAQGAESAEAMMQIPEVDAIMVDHLELLKDANGSFEKSFELVRHIEELAAKYNKPLLSVITDKNNMSAKLRAGYRMALVSADRYALASAINTTVAEFRKTLSVQEEHLADVIIPVKEEEVRVVERALGPTIEERKVASQVLFSRLSLGLLLIVALSFIRAHIISWVY